jgi:Secretion system C-terminal sorting domain/Domain of unknown function (DUF5122) beta-propeller
MKKLVLISVFLIANFLVSAQDWQPLSMGGANSTIFTIVEDTAKGVFYVGGFFNDVGGLPVSKIAMNNGVQWDDMNGGLTKDIYRMEVYNGKLYAGGNGQVLNSAGLVVWNDTLWSSVINVGVTDTFVHDMEVYNNKLYVAVTGWNPAPFGTLYEYDGVTTSVVANFTNSTQLDIISMKVHNGELYVGGTFDSIQGSISAKNIAKWDGLTWSNVGGNGVIDGGVGSIESFNGELYVGGWFQTIDGVSANYIIKRASGNWTTLGIGMDAQVSSMHVHNNDLYIGGDFILADGVTCNKIAKLSGNTFVPVGTGMNGGVLTLNSYNSALYAGGGFSQAGGQNCDNIASFGVVTTIGEGTLNDDIFVYPNPSEGKVWIKGYQGDVTVYSVLGAEVYKGTSKAIDLSELKKGLYFVLMGDISKKILIK